MQCRNPLCRAVNPERHGLGFCYTCYQVVKRNGERNGVPIKKGLCADPAKVLWILIRSIPELDAEEYHKMSKEMAFFTWCWRFNVSPEAARELERETGVDVTHCLTEKHEEVVLWRKAP